MNYIKVDLVSVRDQLPIRHEKGSPRSAAGFASAEVEEQRCACRGCIREHGPDTLVAEQNKNKHDLIRKRSREKGVGKERERRREVPQQLRHWRGRPQAALGGQTQLLTAAKHQLFCHRTES